MNSIFNALQTVALILFIVGLGYFMCLKKWLIPSQHNDIIVKLASFVAMPCVMFGAIFNSFSKEGFIEALPFLALVLLAHIIVYIISKLIAKKYVPKGRQGVFVCICTIGNTVFMGYTVCSGIFGPNCMGDATAFSLITVVLFWSLTYIDLCRDAGQSLSTLGVLKKLLNPAIISGILAIIMVFLDIKLPYFASELISMLSALGTPLGLLFIGSSVYSMGIKNIKLDKYLSWAMLFRFIGSPLIMAVLLTLFGIQGIALSVSIVQSAMPAMVFLSVTASLVGADEKSASTAIIVTTLACLIIIPAYAAITSIL